MQVYDDNAYSEIDPQSLFPRQPHVEDPRWREVAVRPRTQNQTAIKRFPVEAEGVEITTIFVGDTIAIMPEVQYHYFVAARVGYHVGWVNFKHVKLVSLKASPSRFLEETKPQTPISREEIVEHNRTRSQEMQAAHRYSDETQPAPQQRPRQEPPVAKSDIHRIINRLKSLGGLLGKR